ncbi:MAG TPA: cytochrome c [Roseiarcus sp.]|jgi:cytochrome c556
MKRLAVVAMALVCGVTAVLADTDPIAERRALMKHDGAAAKTLFGMMKGSAPFDLATVKESLATLNEGATKSAALFPDNSKTGGGTAALPAIWENKADFEARFAKFIKDVQAAQAGVTDEATFKQFAPAIFKNCGGCHELYKAKSG